MIQGKTKTILRATDLEITIITEIPSSLEEAGVAALPIKTLLDITNELPETRITLSVDGQSHAKIKTDLGDYNLMARQPDDFPATPDQIEVETISIQGAIFKEIIDKTVFAVSRDDAKTLFNRCTFSNIRSRIDCCFNRWTQVGEALS